MGVFEGYVEYQGVSDKNATAVVADYHEHEEGYSSTFQVTASSKRAKGDKHNAEAGQRLATARALEKLARELRASVKDVTDPKESEPVVETPEDAVRRSLRHIITSFSGGNK